MKLKGWRPWYGLDPLDSVACKPYLNWAINGMKDGISTNSFSYLLAHCYDGVCWGRLNPDQTWRLSSQVLNGFSPCISESNILELRLFGNEQELLIWRTEHGFLGRKLFDIPEDSQDNPCRPDDENRILLGDRLMPEEPTKEGFTLVGTARGLLQAVPLECTGEDFIGRQWPLRLEIRHYFEQNECTGVVRVAASRLINVKNVSREVK
ncbi:MAG: hypothetical protein HGA41_00405 [Syntrophaceae bacterium]|nr:hypothetical protein [Syntrophaceae bacterium]